MSEQAREHPFKGRFDAAAARWVRPDAEDGTPGELEIGFAPDGLVAMRRADDPDGTILIYTPRSGRRSSAGSATANWTCASSPRMPGTPLTTRRRRHRPG
ncbi:hypothetical protein GCM10029992_24870 [Glycomyces albus]